jgi:hypothetical protein
MEVEMRRRSGSWMMAAAVALGAGVLPTAPALADAIDGDWCNGANHMEIQGSTIVTPGRNKIEGQYGRYRFAYRIPAGEPGAGGEITMVMIRGQEMVHLTRPGQAGGPEVWRRCKPIS